MKIFHFSDTHSFHKDITIPECDVVVFSGDESNSADVYVNEPEFYDFLDWYGAIKHPHKLMIAGNHSTYIYKNERIVREVCKEKGIIYLNKNAVVIDGINFWGDPMTPTFGNWSFMCKRESIYKHWDLIPENTDVLITHGPPKGILDLSFNRKHELEMCGDGALGKKIKTLPFLRAACFGHIHDGQDVRNSGVLLRDKVLYSNGSCVYDGKFDWGAVNFGNMLEI